LSLWAATAPAATKEEDLKALRNRIEALRSELERKDESRKEARDALRESERAISEANRTLALLETERRALTAQASAIAERRRLLERSLGERQAAIGRMLAARQAAGAPEALRVVLSGEDPAAVSRTLHYVGYVTRASASMLGDYRAGIAEAERLAREADARRERLRSVEQASLADRERILAERRERRRVLERVAGEMRKSRKEIKVLRADEGRLARLVEQLARLIDRAERRPEAQARKEPFSKLRGRLSLPLRGELIGRFGAQRGTTGAKANGVFMKGVFIRAPEGQPVRAIAGGQVVYAEWMRGFGNLLILDHGEAYLSIYANNESLLKQVGDAVALGEAVATSGASGGNEETGLYFEMRHLGRAFDPLRWVKLK
jgi:septal ring factor EnvC (AmiA/AmiB activator)